MGDLIRVCQQELAQSDFQYQRMISQRLPAVWSAVGRIIDGGCETTRGIGIPGFAKWSFVRDTKQPVFTLCEAFVRRNKVEFRRPPPAVQQMSYDISASSIANEVNVPTDQVKATLEAIVEYVGDKLRQKTASGRIKVGSVGHLIFESNRVSFRYSKNILSRIKSREPKKTEPMILTRSASASASKKKGLSLVDLNLDSESAIPHPSDLELQNANLKLIDEKEQKRKDQLAKEIEDVDLNLANLKAANIKEKKRLLEEQRRKRELANKQKRQAEQNRLRELAQMEENSKEKAGIYFPFRSSEDAAAERQQKDKDYRAKLDAEKKQHDPEGFARKCSVRPQDATLIKSTSAPILPRFLLPDRGPGGLKFMSEKQENVVELAYKRYANEKEAEVAKMEKETKELNQRREIAEKRHWKNHVMKQRTQANVYSDLSKQVAEKRQRNRIEKANRRMEIGANGRAFPVEKVQDRAKKAEAQSFLCAGLDYQIREKRHEKERQKIVELEEEKYFLDSVKHQLGLERYAAKEKKRVNQLALMADWDRQKEMEKMYTSIK